MSQQQEPQGGYIARKEIGYRADEPPPGLFRIDLSSDVNVDELAEHVRLAMEKALREEAEQMIKSAQQSFEVIEPDEPQDLTRLVAHLEMLKSAGMRRKDLANHGYEYALTMYRADCEANLKQDDELTSAQQKQIMDLSAYWLSQAMRQIKEKSK